MENVKISLISTFHGIDGDNNNHGDCFFMGLSEGVIQIAPN